MAKQTLKCPYTGAEQVPVYDDDTRSVGWYLSGGANISLPFIRKEEAEQYPVCKHTGSKLSPLRKGALYYLPGAYDTTTRYPSVEHCLYYGSFRNGKTNRKKPVEIQETRERELTPDPFADRRNVKTHIQDAVSDKLEQLLA